MRTAPGLSRYLFAVCVSFATAGIVIVAFLATGPSPPMSWLIPALACAVLALVFALRWPEGSWRWGVWLSSGFWVFFLVVFVSYLLTSTVDWKTPLRAVAVLLPAIAAALLGAALRRRPAS